MEENQPFTEHLLAAPILVKSQCLLLFLKEITVVMKCNNLYLRLVTPSSGPYTVLISKTILKTISYFSFIQILENRKKMFSIIKWDHSSSIECTLISLSYVCKSNLQKTD